ncbi:MFS transporter [Cellulomonas phragmiteti]|uniref:MFS transporter n=1 Tax=Cellulomonas phragmiteti TaxID=478780 RepID=A0ABQ4DIU7_9CELL|nr:MFS transporter [Cellulomonas phragmiteti]GIG39260.1 MFS transporter [Cellulomonas phragmiteti]
MTADPEPSTAPDPGPAPARAALRSRDMRLLTGVWTAANLADSLLTLILAVWVKDLTGSDALAGLTLASLGVPALFTPVIGHVVDRTSRRRLLAGAYAVGGLTLLPLLAVRGPAGAWLVLAVTVVYATVGYTTAAAQSGLLRDLLPDAALGAANGRLTTIDQSFRLTMPVLGAGVYALAGPLPLVVAAVVAFAVAALLALRLRVRETPPEPHGEPFRRAVTAGFRHLRRTPPLGTLTLALGLGFGVTGMINGVAFAVLDRSLGLPPEMLGPLTSAQAATAVVAGLTAARLLARWGAPRLVAGALLLAAAGVVPLLGTSVVGVVVGMGAIGAGVTWAVVGFVTERQVRTPPTLQGRVQAAGALVLHVPQLALALTAASLVDVVDHRVLVAVCAAGLAASAVLASRAGRGQPRGPGPRDVAADESRATG